MNSLKEKISAFGGNTKLSIAMTEWGLKTTPQMVNGWIARNRVPDEKLWAFCEVTGYTPSEIRPDLFPTPEEYWSRTRKIIEKRTA